MPSQTKIKLDGRSLTRPTKRSNQLPIFPNGKLTTSGDLTDVDHSHRAYVEVPHNGPVTFFNSCYKKCGRFISTDQFETDWYAA